MSSLTDVDAQRTIDETISEHEETISELEARILELKKMISEVEATILALKTRRNTHCAISKVPTELISNVFLHAKQLGYAHQSKSWNDDQSDSCDASDASDDDQSDSDSSRNWLNVASVCRQWRAIVLDTPHLWRSISLSWEAGALEFLKRSKSVPIRVWYASDYGDYIAFNSPAIKAVMTEQRVQELDIVFSEPRSLVRLLNLNPSGSAPALEVLRLKLSDAQDAPLPMGTFWHDMPALQVLELSGVPFSSELPVLPRLTRLVLRKQPASWVIQSLRNTPLVEEIDISHLSSDFVTEMPALPPVSLPKLTSLRIKADDLIASKMFDFIEYPSSTIVACEFTCFLPPNALDLSTLRYVFPRIVNGGTIDQVRVDAGRWMQLWRSDVATRPSLTLCLPLLSSDSITRYLRFCSILDSSCHGLSLIGFENWGIAKMLVVWAFFPQFTTLVLTGCSADTLLSLLRTGKMQRPPLEKLEVITIRKCSFNFPDHRRSDAICDAMVSVLKPREEGGMPLQKLILRNCYITEDIINEFRSHVKDVEVS